VLGRASALPIGSDSIDAVLLPHTLEFAADPYSIVREADRVLVAEGQLIVMGFRPWSLWGLRASASRSGFPPGMRRVLSQGRVQDWLELWATRWLPAGATFMRAPGAILQQARPAPSCGVVL